MKIKIILTEKMTSPNKIVIVGRFGGRFSISTGGVARLAELGYTEAIGEMKKPGLEIYQYTVVSDILENDRMNPLLVQMVEELGEAAGSDLKVVTFTGEKYLIKKDDGGEYLMTPSDMSWKTVPSAKKTWKVVISRNPEGFVLSEKILRMVGPDGYKLPRHDRRLIEAVEQDPESGLSVVTLLTPLYQIWEEVGVSERVKIFGDGAWVIINDN